MLDFKNLTEAICFSSKGTRSVTFIQGDKSEKTVTYGEIFRKSGYILYFLQARGVKPDDEVILQLDDNESFVCAFWACVIGGIIPVPVTTGGNDEHKSKLFKIWKVLNNPYLMTDEKTLATLEKFASGIESSGIMREIAAKTLFIGEAEGVKEQGAIVDRDPDNIAYIQFSSGSTSDPKGVILTHENLLTNINAIIECSEVTKTDSGLSWMPLTHDMGLIGFHLTPLVYDIDHYLMPTALFIRHPVLWLKKAFEHKATILSSPNFGYKYFLSHFKDTDAENWDLSHVKLIYNGAEPISAKLCSEFLDRMEAYKLRRNVIFPVYGLAEASLAVSFTPVSEELVPVHLDRGCLALGQTARETGESNKECLTFVDVGYAGTGCSFRICDGDNNELPERVVGYIQIKGRNVTRGYFNNKEATDSAITGDGWLNTGDLGFVRNKRLVITGRAKDIIFVNGKNYYPHDIERMAEGVEGIELGEVAACGVFDREMQTEDVVLFVLFKKKPEDFIPLAINLRKYITRQMGIKIRDIIPLKKLPKTTSGKIQRYKLVESYNEGEFEEVISEIRLLMKREMQNRIAGTPGNEVEERLLSICREVLEVENIGINDNFTELGGDSILLTRVHAGLEELYPGRVKVTDLFTYPTVAKLAQFIQNPVIVHLDTVTLPDGYFNGGGEQNEYTVLEFCLEGETFEKTRSILKTGEVELMDLAAGAYIYLLADISEDNRITIQVKNDDDEDGIIPLSLEFSSVSDLPGFFEQLVQKRSEKQGAARYSVKNLGRISLDKGDKGIIPFICRYGSMNAGVKLLNIYDMVLSFQNNGTGMDFTFEFGRVLRKDRMAELMDSYISIFRAMVEKYSEVMEEVAST